MAPKQNGAVQQSFFKMMSATSTLRLLIVAALTSKTDKKVTQATHCQVEEDGLKPSIVQAEQIFTIDKSRVLKFVGHLSPENMRRSMML